MVSVSRTGRVIMSKPNFQTSFRKTNCCSEAGSASLGTMKPLFLFLFSVTQLFVFSENRRCLFTQIKTSFLSLITSILLLNYFLSASLGSMHFIFASFQNYISYILFRLIQRNISQKALDMPSFWVSSMMSKCRSCLIKHRNCLIKCRSE